MPVCLYISHVDVSEVLLAVKTSDVLHDSSS